MRFGLPTRLRRLFALALIVLMSAAPAIASGVGHSAHAATDATHCQNDAADKAAHNDAEHAAAGHATAEHAHDGTAKHAGATQSDECYLACCGLACHASMALLSGTIMPPPSHAERLAPTASAGIAQPDTARIDRPPISRL